jgi:hypothetical protein
MRKSGGKKGKIPSPAPREPGSRAGHTRMKTTGLESGRPGIKIAESEIRVGNLASANKGPGSIFMTWQETLKVIISGLNFLHPDQREQLLLSLEILNRNRPENWQEMIRDYFRLTLRICAPNSFLTERLQKAQEAFERSLIVDEIGREILSGIIAE